MAKRSPTSCRNCQQLQQQLEDLRAQFAALQLTVLKLQEQLAQARKNSSTSSKPPSSDIVQPPKPPPPDGQTQRAAGGQPGHPHHQRALLPPEQLSGGRHSFALDCCPDCGQALQSATVPAKVVQQIELPVVPLEITEYRSEAGWCPHCQRHRFAPLPEPVVRGGLTGPRLMTWIAYLKGACHASYATVRKFLRDVLKVTISRGQLAKIIGKVSRALEQPYQELFDRLPHEARLNVDETGHKDQGELWWTWCFRAPLFTLFRIEPSRSAEVLLHVLGTEFNGVLGCDYFSAYRRYMRECDVVVQFCLAHLIRDVQFLTTLPDVRDRAYGERLREALRQLFGVIHQRAELSERTFDRRLRAARDEVLTRALQDVPPTKHSQILFRRLAKHGAAYFEFVTTPGVEPTNNLAEQAIRFVVLDRQVTQGTRGEKGQEWSERIWTVMATCYQQGTEVFGYLEQVVRAWLEGSEAPSLLGEANS
jgi:transposase